MQLKELKADEFAKIRKLLILKKGSDLQIAFIKAARTKETFIAWIEERVSYDNLDVHDVPLYPEKLTENEFKDTTRDVERLAFDTWNSLTPSIACRSSFWGALTLNHIQHDIISPSFLAVTNQSSQSGLSRIEEALLKKKPEAIDKVVRTILRRFSGLPEARGILRTICVNCTFGRAWWRECITNEVIASIGGDGDAISRTLRMSQEYWEQLVTFLSTQNSVFGDEKIRTAFIWALSDYVDNEKYERLFLGKGLVNKCMKTLSVYSACQEFGVFEHIELKTFILEKIIHSVMRFDS